MKFLAFLLTMLSVACGTALSLDFQSVTAGGKKYTVCHVNLDNDQLRLFLNDDASKPFKSFDAVQRWLDPRNQKLLFAMNAGMYQMDFSPVGLFVSGGRVIAPLNLKSSTWGNFFLKPNGVFFVNESGAHIVESSRYPAAAGHVILATQSGPMLVINGKIHSAFQPESQSRLFRNGVGILSPKEVVFVISEEPVNFYEFASYFRDGLHCKNALFFDGTISSLHSLELKRSDRKTDLGPVIGVVSNH